MGQRRTGHQGRARILTLAILTIATDPTHVIAIVALFVSLGLDTLAVALSLGIAGVPRSQWLRVGLTFAICEGITPVIGILLGRAMSAALGSAAGAVGGLIVIGVGLRSLFEERDPEPSADASARLRTRVASMRTLIPMGLGVSLDELAVGFSLGAVRAWLPIAVAGVALQAAVLTFVGLLVGQKLGTRLAERADRVAGLLLIAVGVALLWGGVTDVLGRAR